MLIRKDIDTERVVCELGEWPCIVYNLHILMHNRVKCEQKEVLVNK